MRRGHGRDREDDGGSGRRSGTSATGGTTVRGGLGDLLERLRQPAVLDGGCGGRRDGRGLGRHRLGRKRERRDRGVDVGLEGGRSARRLRESGSGSTSFFRSESSFFQIEVGFSPSATVRPLRS